MRSRDKRRNLRRHCLERLEDRRLLTTFYWDAGLGGSSQFFNPQNWDTDDDFSTPREDRELVPGNGDSVYIEGRGASVRLNGSISLRLVVLNNATLTTGGIDFHADRILAANSTLEMDSTQASGESDWEFRNSEFVATDDSELNLDWVTLRDTNLEILDSVFAVRDKLDSIGGDVKIDGSTLTGNSVLLSGGTDPSVSIELRQVDTEGLKRLGIFGIDVTVDNSTLVADEIGLTGQIPIPANSRIHAKNWFGVHSVDTGLGLPAIAATLEMSGGSVVVGTRTRDLESLWQPNQISVLQDGVLFLEGRIAGNVQVLTEFAREFNDESPSRYDGQLRGFGRIDGDLINQGVIDAPTSATSNNPVLSIGGDFIQEEDGILSYELDSLGTLKVDGDAVLAGTVHFEIFASNPKPGIGDRVPLLHLSDQDGLSGRFDEVEGITRFQFDVGTPNPDSLFHVVHYNQLDATIELLIAETPRRYTEKEGNPQGYPRLTKAGRTERTSASHLVLIAPGSAADANTHVVGSPVQPNCEIDHPDTREPEAIALSAEWAHRLARAIYQQNPDGPYDVVTLDWSHFSTGHPNDKETHCWEPRRSVAQAISIGESLGQLFESAGIDQYESIHVISHSAGAWLADAFVDRMESSNLRVNTHLTLLDAFVPGIDNRPLQEAVLNVAGMFYFWDFSPFTRWGDVDPNLSANDLGDTADFADHYFDGRKLWEREIFDFRFQVPAVPLTDSVLPNFFNVDITRLESPDLVQIPAEDRRNLNYFERLDSHSWPKRFYLETVTPGAPWSETIFGFGNTIERHGHDGVLQEIHKVQSPQLFKLRKNGRVTSTMPTANLTTGEFRQASGDGSFGQSGVSIDLRTSDSIEINTEHAASDPAYLHLDIDAATASGILEVSIDDRTISSIDLDSATDRTRDSLLTITLPIAAEDGPLTGATVSIRLLAKETTPATVTLQSLRFDESTSTIEGLTNPVDPYDVDQNEQVTARDALLIINRLARLANGQGESIQWRYPIAEYLDPSGDFKVTARDALVVINELARRSVAQAAGEATQVNPQRRESLQEIQDPRDESESLARRDQLFADQVSLF